MLCAVQSETVERHVCCVQCSAQLTKHKNNDDDDNNNNNNCELRWRKWDNSFLSSYHKQDSTTIPSRGQ